MRPSKPEFAAKLSEWIASRGSANTRAAYGRDIASWLAFCREHKHKPDQPPQSAAVAFRDALLTTKAPLSVRRTLACLSAAYSFVAPTTPNPFSERALPRPPASSYARTEAVSDEDVRAMIDACADAGKVRDVAILRVLWSTGMRRASVASIRREGVVRRADSVVVRYINKGAAEEESELPPETVSAIDAWLEVAPASRWLFCTLNGKGGMSPQAIGKVVESAANLAGVKAHPHMFRAAAATTLLDANTPLEQVKSFLHHKDPRTTLGYDRGQRGAGVAKKLADFRAGKR